MLLGDCPEIDVLKGNHRLMLAETAKDDAEQHGSHIIFLQDKPTGRNNLHAVVAYCSRLAPPKRAFREPHHVTTGCGNCYSSGSRLRITENCRGDMRCVDQLDEEIFFPV